MTAKQIAPGVYALSLGIVNVFLIDADDGLTLIDTGPPGCEAKILAAIRSLGKQPSTIRQILVTHCHYDHTGSLAALKRMTNAPAYMHPADADLVRTGKAGRTFEPAPGLLNSLVVRLFMGSIPSTVAATEIEHAVNDGDELPVAGGMKAIHAPGHCAGQLAFLWPHHNGVLFAADAAANVIRLGSSFVYEDYAEGQRSLAKLAALDFDVACFGHGNAIVGGAAQRFRQKWGTPVARKDAAA